MKWRPYPNYKDSGVEWLGKVPEDWTVSALAYRYEVALGKMLDGNRIVGDHLAPYLRNVDVQWDRINSLDLPEMDFNPSDRCRFGLRPRDLLVCEGGEVGRAAIWAGQLDECYYQKALHRLRAHRTERDDGRFMLYVLWDSALKGRFTSNEGRSTIAHLTAEALRRYLFVFPPKQEQVQVALHLDRETARIDTLITKQERLIELLQEKRQALISHAVTKGLNPDAPTKPSGVEWLGDVPAHWAVKRIKWVARMESGHTPDKKIDAYWENCDIPWVSLNDTSQLRVNDYVDHTAFQVNALGIANSSARLLPQGTVVFSRDATVGLCAITNRTMAVSQHFIAWVCGCEILPEFLLFALRSMVQELEKRTMGATIKTIGMPDVRTLAVPVPPVDEQQNLVSHIFKQRERLDTAIGKTQLSIALMREHRTALISAAVTGKIDVRESSHA